MDIIIDDDNETQPPEDILSQQVSGGPHIEMGNLQGFSQQYGVAEDEMVEEVEEEMEDISEESKMEFDVHFDPLFSPTKPLKRHFRRKVIKEIYPYYSPDGIHCCSYTTTIIKLFKHFTQKLIQAQKRSNTTIPWGKPVVPGKHHSKTIDFKKRGCPSIDFDSSEDDKELIKILPRTDIAVSRPDAKLEKKTPERVNKHIIFTSGEDSKIEDYEAETQGYDNSIVIDNDDDSDFNPSLNLRVKPKGKQRIIRKRKQSVSPLEFLQEKQKPHPSVSTDDLEFINQIPDSQSNSKDSKSSSQSKSSSKDDWLPSSQGSNSLLNSQGDIYSTQINQRRTTKQTESKPTKKLHVSKKNKVPVETVICNLSSGSSDDEMLTSHLKSVSNKKRKLLPKNSSLLRNDEIFGEEDTNIKSKVSRTYLKKDQITNSDKRSQSFDYEKYLTNPVLKYTPSSPIMSSQTYLEDRGHNDNIPSETLKTDKFTWDELEETPLATVKPNKRKRKSFNSAVSESDEENDAVVPLTHKNIKSTKGKRPLKQQKIVNQNVNYNKRIHEENLHPFDSGCHIVDTVSLTVEQVEQPSDEVVLIDPVSVNRVSPQQFQVNDTPPVSREATPTNSQEIVVIPEEMVDCPLCNQSFSMDRIERHAATCGLEDEIEQVEEPELRPQDVDDNQPVRQTRSTFNRN